MQILKIQTQNSASKITMRTHFILVSEDGST